MRQCLASFWHITLPMLRQIIAIILILRTAFAFPCSRRFSDYQAGRATPPGSPPGTATRSLSRRPIISHGLGIGYILALMIGAIALVICASSIARVTL